MSNNVSIIRPAVSFGITNKDSLERLKKISVPIQLSVFKLEIYEEFKKKVIKIIKDNKIQVNVVHLPVDLLSQEPESTIEMMEFLNNELLCEKFVIHPNRGVVQFLHYFINKKRSCYQLCIENFPWRRKKELRSPLVIHDICKTSDILKIAFDTSHAEEVWFDHKVFKYLVDKISVIHLSNRVGKKQHQPFNKVNGDLQLVSFVKQLKKIFNWDGDIVLEYMPEYSSYLYRNLDYLERLIRVKQHETTAEFYERICNDKLSKNR